jgi:hypothetical protein
VNGLPFKAKGLAALAVTLIEQTNWRNQMYIVIFEDGQAYKASEITAEDKQCADDGYIDIINCETMMSYRNGSQILLPEWGSDSE